MKTNSMKTKEEILQKSRVNIGVTAIIDFDSVYYREKEVLEAMDEYAQAYHSECNNSFFEFELKELASEEKDNFACAFLVFAMCDPLAKALLEAKTPPAKVLEFYKDRAYLDTDPSKQ